MQLGLDHMSTRECQNALAGGANAILVPDGTLHLSQLGALSSSGRCKTLSAFADGYGRGEGFATVLVGPHDDAENSHLCSVLSISVNHDGRASGLTAPHGPSQEQLIVGALAKAGGFTPSFVSLHGTGTSLGDPIEVGALSNALSSVPWGKTRRSHVELGASKLSLGHTESSAGIAGALLALLASSYIALSPFHLRELNPFVAEIFTKSGTPLSAPLQARPGTGGMPTSSSSSFGMSGTNGHVLLSASRGQHVHQKIRHWRRQNLTVQV